MEKNKIIAGYLLSKVIEQQSDAFNRLSDIINKRYKDLTQDQLIANLQLIKGVLGPLENDLVEIAKLLDIEDEDLYPEE